jgi:uncharacterized protein (DUF305 family)
LDVEMDEQVDAGSDVTADNGTDGADAVVRSATSDATDDQVIADATMRRFSIGFIVGVGLLVVIGVFAAAAIWAAGDDEPEPLGVTDVGFLQDMIDHHEQALLIAEAYLANNPDGDVAPFADEVILYQTRDIGRMETWLEEGGFARGEPDRQAMGWMGSPTSVAEMHGMQDTERIAELATLTGHDADRRFFELMTAHHEGGVLMGDAAALDANREAIRTFARKMADGQRVEIVEYAQAADRLGL